jgi:hypothetical protein
MITASMLLVMSCGNKNEIVFVEKHKIISHLLDSQTIPTLVPPPPPPSGVVDTLSAERDSIINVISSDDWKNQKLTIAVNSKLTELNLDNIIKYEIPKDYEFIFSEQLFIIDNNPRVVPLLKTKKGHNLSIAPTNDSMRSNSKLWDSVDVIVSFSEIIFSKDLKKAVLIFGESFGRRNGTSHFLFLKKEDENWKVLKSITYEIS